MQRRNSDFIATAGGMIAAQRRNMENQSVSLCSLPFARFSLLFIAACGGGEQSVSPSPAAARLNEFRLSARADRTEDNRQGALSVTLNRRDGRCPADTSLGENFRGTANGVPFEILSKGRQAAASDGSSCDAPTLLVGIAELWPTIEAAGGKLVIALQADADHQTWVFENMAQPGSFGPSSIDVDQWDGEHPVSLEWAGPLALTGVIAWQPNIKDESYLAASDRSGNRVTLTPQTFVDSRPSKWVPAAAHALKPGPYVVNMQAFFVARDEGGQAELQFPWTQPITINVQH